MVVDSVDDIRKGDLVLHFQPAWMALSALAVLATYAVLIWSWLYVLEGLSGQRVRFLAGARIWFISALGTLLPGRIWQVVQMSAMSVDAGISPVSSATAAIINAAVNIATGMAIGVITAAPIFATYFGDRREMVWLVAGVAAVAVVALPILVPWGFTLLRKTGLSVPEQPTPPRVIVVSTVCNVLSWFLYGAAFLFLNRATVDPAAVSVTEHTAAFATSYIIGYMMLFVPAGIAFREKALIEVLVTGGMTTPAPANALAVVSRLWLTIIMVLPALIFLAYRRPPNEKDPAAG
jgi:glycosyltransferase 2 family protein